MIWDSMDKTAKCRYIITISFIIIFVLNCMCVEKEENSNYNYNNYNQNGSIMNNSCVIDNGDTNNINIDKNNGNNNNNSNNSNNSNNTNSKNGIGNNKNNNINVSNNNVNNTNIKDNNSNNGNNDNNGDDNNIHNINSFHYQLQNTEFKNLKNLNVSLIIIDPDDANLTKEQILELKKNKIVLAYLSIGEAEDYRDYWKDNWKVGNPTFIEDENPDWEGNYRVKYWNSEWQNIIFKKVEYIAKMGYSGVYLDKIDTYEDYKDNGIDDADIKMLKFVKKIRAHAKNINPNFMIVPQNAPELYNKYDDYKSTIDGIGCEDVFYNDDEIQNREESELKIYCLNEIKKDGKFVLVIDYPTERYNINDFHKKCEFYGFSGAVFNRELDE